MQTRRPALVLETLHVFQARKETVADLLGDPNTGYICKFKLTGRQWSGKRDPGGQSALFRLRLSQYQIACADIFRIIDQLKPRSRRTEYYPR